MIGSKSQSQPNFKFFMKSKEVANKNEVQVKSQIQISKDLRLVSKILKDQVFRGNY